MEIESQNGSKIRVEEDIDFGRGLGFGSTDRTVSRRHVSFKPHEEDGSSVCFQVKGKNPIWVRHSTNPHIIRVYNPSQSGQLHIGDSFCVSSKHPVWFHLNKIASQVESNSVYEEAFAALDHHEIETGHVSNIDDPVKEFSFVVMGHEFDSYQKKLIRDIRNWNWFLEEPNEEEEEEEEEEGEKKSRKKRKKSGRRDDNDDDEVWTGESEEEEDVESIKKLRNDMKPKYSTRSKEKGRKGAGASKSVKDGAKTSDEDEYDGEDDEDEEGDETLGGFIVDDEDIGEGDEDDDDDDDDDDRGRV